MIRNLGILVEIASVSLEKGLVLFFERERAAGSKQFELA
jgi:hypothetical protein